MTWIRRPEKKTPEEEKARLKEIEQMRMRDPVYYYNTRGGICIEDVIGCDVCGKDMVTNCGGYYFFNWPYDREDFEFCLRQNKPLPKRLRMYFRDDHYNDDMRFLKNPRVCAGYTDEEDFNGVMCDECNADYYEKKQKEAGE